MNSRKLLYIVISIICVIAIFIAVYYQIFKTNKNTNNNNNEQNPIVSNNNNNDDDTIDLEKIKSDFNKLFVNKFKSSENEEYEVEKYYEDKDFIFTFHEYKEEKEDLYNVNLNIPAFNIKESIAVENNKSIQEIFVNKANDIIKNSSKYTIYNIDYVAYENDGIISLVIKSTLKEGSNAQRIIVQTYNYDIKNNKEITLSEILREKGINKQEVNKKIETQVKYANTQAEAIAEATMQTIYKRDINNAMYIVDNMNNFFITDDGKIYIVYAYGNTNFTSEMDIIIVE